MENKLENKQYSFLELLEKVGIKIPIIQRDYAQGRDDNKTKSIRENFLTNLFDVVNQGKILNLDFVYGIIKDNYLIPLDGQQRLTTLFLLHYYLGLKEEKSDDNLKNKLKKFTYETRISSREFCKLLIENKITLSNENISQTITNQTWFFSEWENDPTIKSMLIMLNSIENIFQNCETGFENLNNITFSFLNLEEFKLTDELYIKMNARGKPLSDFENFKSKFENYIDNSNLDDKEKIKAKLDNDWLDIFWKLEKENLEKIKKEDDEKRKEILKSIDDKYFNFFKNITAFFSKDFNEVDVFKFTYNTFHINIIIKILDSLINYAQYQNIINEIRDNLNIFEDFLNLDNTKAEYEKRMRFYALILYFINKEFNPKEFKEWIRVSINIIHNTLYNSEKEFNRDKKILHKLVKLLGTKFYDKLSKSNISDIKQFEEEKIKAKLILNNSFNKSWDWEEEFIKIEKHWYLNGQIGFLIDYAKWNFNDFTEFNDFYEFSWYRDKFIKLWNYVKDNKDNQILLYQALLTNDDYLPKIGQNYTFCNFEIALRTKMDNWRKVFGKNCFKKLLDDIVLDNDIEKELNKIIENYLKQYENCNNRDDKIKYLYTLISNPENIKYCKKSQIRWETNDKVYLLGKTRMSGKHAELYTYNLFTSKGLKDKEHKYFSSSSKEYSCIYFDFLEQNNNKFAIDIFYHNKKFLIRFFDRNKNKFSQNLIDYLDNKNFKENKYPNIREYGYWNDEFDLCNQDDFVKFIEKLENHIKNITILHNEIL